MQEKREKVEQRSRQDRGEEARIGEEEGQSKDFEGLGRVRVTYRYLSSLST